MSLFGQTKRHTPTSKPRRSPLPVFMDTEKRYSTSRPGSPIFSGSRWFTIIYVPIPFLYSSAESSNGNGIGSPTIKPFVLHHSHGQKRHVRMCLPIPPRVFARIPRLNTPLRLAIGLFFILGLALFLLGFRRTPQGSTTWSPPFVDPNTVVLSPEELAMIWEWEVLSGHYPSLHPPPEHIPLASTIHNPAVPEALLPSLVTPSPLVAYHQRTTTAPRTQIIGVGPERHFISAWDSIDPAPGFPPRPTPGTVLDLDLVHDRCDFGNNQYVRDCLEFLRIGGGLDNGRRVRRGNYLTTYKQMYFESGLPTRSLDWSARAPMTRAPESSRAALQLSQPQAISGTYDASDPCDPLHPRVFHMFWAGAFTDKPYMAVMSFLFTQNLGLDSPLSQQSNVVRNSCRPQFWVWINPGPAAAVPNPSARREMYEQLATNPWSAPFLHERFRDVVKFRMWNTTEQLDGIPELKDHWRAMPIFNSGGNVYKQAQQQQAPRAEATEDNVKIGDIIAEAEAETTEAPVTKKKKDGLFEKVGSSSESDYDRLSVILSDMARFVLTYRFGGIYLDADTIFLRDWEELWNYRGQFAYRWSWHQKYNTAVLKLHKGSALGTFLFKTALENGLALDNGLDFHPMTVSRYLKDAGLESLLFRVPDALFDPAWLNMERYQRDRPPFPYFPEFSAFFSNDKFDTAGAQPLGFDGFFRGAYSYHFHNFWWLPFDPSRNFPDLGPRFIKGEQTLREAQRAAKAAALSKEDRTDEDVTPHDTDSSGGSPVSSREDMDDELDLSWSTVLKRTFEAYLRNERPSAYGEWLNWDEVS
ncbi:hypothetical protein BCR39DRAFT_526993 [Naematelia encephala]|uniref:Glycosyltransferase family 32 protein n=1 Tax=Naematelia encephala TaxID=71784 RepID=A0A1Y2B8T2_9TREE|nr:hypothetical protein BCR39DRAFT_526993 [Naematelia encephala]